MRSGQGSLSYPDISITSNPAPFGSTNVGATSEQAAPVIDDRTASDAPAQLWKTGQTTSYATGDDGNLERGVAWPDPRFTDHGDGTVTDNLTGLMWAKNANLAGGTKTWQGALDYVKSMNSGAGLGGHHDWRLPNRKELFSLIDRSRYDPALPADHLFQINFLCNLYWSSTSGAHQYTWYAWIVSMYIGSMTSIDKTYNNDYSCYVWPVRSGQVSLYPDISVTPNPVSFGNVNVGDTSDQTATIKNDGNANLVIGAITQPTQPFSKIQDNCSEQTIAPNSTCTVTYRFAPTTLGNFSSNSDIPSNDPDENPVTVTLNGVGVAETITIPNILTGPINGTTGNSYTYTTGGSVSNLGHSVWYRFDWGDGTYSPWSSSTSAFHSWSSANSYTIKVQAQCATDISVVSGWSLGLTVTISSGSPGTATRDLPGCYTPSTASTVTITVTPSTTTNSYAVEDSPPNGWTVSNINENGQWDSVNKKVKWGPFFDHNSRAFTYQATPPVVETETKMFSGSASFDGMGVVVGGDSAIGVCSFHPAETNYDYRIGMNEVTAYGAAWKTGQNWPTPPNPIPVEYVTNAVYLWKMGEVYHYDGSASPPWVPGAASIHALTNQTTLQIPIGLGTGSATRTLPSTYEPSVVVSVSISVNPGQGTQGYAVEETPPNGWGVSDINESGQWDSVNKKVKWGPFFDANNRTLTYKATPPVGETGTKTFSGTASFDGTNVTISGSSSILRKGAAIPDFNGDGRADILWRNKTTGQNVVWFMDGTTYSNYAELMQVTDTNWHIMGTGDFNGDGKTDILWRNKSTGQNVVWLMDGVNYGGYAWLLEVADLSWEIVGTGDFNSDGKVDILWRNKSTGQNIVWLMDGTTYSSYTELQQVTDTNWEVVGPK